MKILLSNDDGVQAPGLIALAKALSQIAQVTVVAPDRNRTGASHSLTLDAPLRIQRLDNGFISVQGTPTDCVHLAITGLLDDEPDMVVSGINAGSNLGDDVLYSGTVAAAVEGRFLGLPAIAVSLAGKDFFPEHYLTAATVVKNIIMNVQNHALPEQTILNVNVPDVPLQALQGVEVTRLGTRHRAEPTIKGVDPRGGVIYWVGMAGPEQDAGLGTDFYAVNNNRVSVTPLQLDLTHYKAFAQISSWIDGLTLL